MNDAWERVLSTTVVPCYRSGWRGVLDALYAAITRRPRLTVATEFTYSVYIKKQAGSDVKINITYPCVEVGKP